MCLKTTRNVAKWDVTSVQWAPMLSNRIAIGKKILKITSNSSHNKYIEEVFLNIFISMLI